MKRTKYSWLLGIVLVVSLVLGGLWHPGRAGSPG